MSLDAHDGEDFQRPPFGETLRLSFQRLFQGVVRMPLTFAIVTIGLTAIAVGSSFGPVLLTSSIGALGTFARSLTLIVWSFAQSVVRLLLLVPLSMTMYRFALRDETNAWRAVARNIPAFFSWSVLVDALTSVMDALRVLSPMRFLMVATFLASAGSLLIAMLGIRLWLIFPAIALGKPAPFLERASISWRQTRGHFWYLFWMDTAATLALTLPFWLISYAMAFSTMSRTIAQPRTAVGLTYTVLAAAIGSIGVALGAGANASIGGEFYRAVVEGGLSGAEQTAEHFT